jgi:hypothetical protein
MIDMPRKSKETREGASFLILWQNRVLAAKEYGEPDDLGSGRAREAG